jgi:hypothetical protein
MDKKKTMTLKEINARIAELESITAYERTQSQIKELVALHQERRNRKQRRKS